MVGKAVVPPLRRTRPLINAFVIVPLPRTIPCFMESSNSKNTKTLKEANLIQGEEAATNREGQKAVLDDAAGLVSLNR